MSEDNRERNSTGLVPGLIVVGIGVLFLLSNLHIIHIRDFWSYWPVILIAIGITRVVESPMPNQKTGGAIMIIIGGLFLSNNLGILPYRVWDFWPVLLIGAGLMMLLNRTGAFGGLHVPRGVHAGRRDRADAFAMFGGFKRQVSGDDYRGARYVAIFGGGEIDLRRAQMQEDTAVVEITAIFGGFELKVPTNWLVVNEVVGIFGGTGDETIQPNPNMPGIKRLIVRGTAVFGGVGIKN